MNQLLGPAIRIPDSVAEAKRLSMASFAVLAEVHEIMLVRAEWNAVAQARRNWEQ